MGVPKTVLQARSPAHLHSSGQRTLHNGTTTVTSAAWLMRDSAALWLMRRATTAGIQAMVRELTRAGSTAHGRAASLNKTNDVVRHPSLCQSSNEESSSNP